MPDSAMAYLDESGDLGWKLDQPYLAGGSSRYFVIAIAMGMNQSYRRFGRVVDQLHKVQGWTSKKEKKWATINPGPRAAFCQLAARELASNPELKVMIAVYRKEHPPGLVRAIDVRARHPAASDAGLIKREPRYKGGAHLVYAMMVAETLAEHLPPLKTFSYCPDELNEGQRALEHILAYRLLFQQQRDLVLKQVVRVDAMRRGLDFADLCAGAAFEAYQRGDSTYLDILAPHVIIKNFSSPNGESAAFGM